MRPPRLRPLVALALGALGLPAPAAAQSVREGEFSAQRFHPAPGPRNFLTVEGARVGDAPMSWSAGAFFHYARRPFVARPCRSLDECDRPVGGAADDIFVVDSLATADLLASLTPLPRLQLGLRLPVTHVRGDGFDVETGRAQRGGLRATGLGDPMLEAKVRALGAANAPWALGAALFATAPLGRLMNEDSYVGDGSPSGGLRAIVDHRRGPLSLAGNLAGVLRQTARVGPTVQGSELRYGAAAGFAFSPVVRPMVELFGATRFQGSRATNPLEGAIALELTPLDAPLHLYAGAGAGLVRGVGAPAFRGFVGAVFAVEGSGDADADALPDARDRCPTEREDFDGFEDDDGCPEDDNDRDGLADARDRCASEPETQNGYQDDDGCPDELPDRDKDGIVDPDDKCPELGGEVVRAPGASYGCPDRDKDGIADNVDKCPADPEDTDGFDDADGCLDPDNDGDGVPDPEDECVDQPGSRARGGCPEPDRDGDGVPDGADRCPERPETFNGFADGDGCPDAAPNALIEVTPEAIKLREKVQFATDSDKIVGPKSTKVLDQIAAVLAADRRILRVEVSGHTDNVGPADKNRDLSRRRADAVVAYLAKKKGVPAGKIVAVGLGPDKPVADNNTPEGREQNRRVEFKLVRGATPPPPPGAAPPAPRERAR
ncbi:MAG TPA: OmpA family protein [Polyangiaceae bacterium]|nr:OmpA family protein [Polyangiaceae bacterium]